MCLAAVNGYRLWQLRRQGITKTNTQANWHGHCMVAYKNTTHGDVTLNCSTKGRTEPGNGEIANTPTNQIWKCKTKSKIPSNPVNQFAGILRVFCGYSAGILRVFCGIYGLCFSRAILLWICKGFAGRDGGGGEGGHESLRWRPTCEAGSLLEMSGSNGLIQGHPPPFQECSKLFWHALSHEWRQQLHESISMLLATASKSWSLVLDALQVLDAPLVPPYLWPADPTAIKLLQKTMPIINPSFPIIVNNVICRCFGGILLKPCLFQPCFHVAGRSLHSEPF